MTGDGTAFDVHGQSDFRGRDRMTMAEKNIVVTGASSGLGLAASLLLAEQGARVGMICRNPVRGRFMRNEVAKPLSKGGDQELRQAQLGPFWVSLCLNL